MREEGLSLVAKADALEEQIEKVTSTADGRLEDIYRQYMTANISNRQIQHQRSWLLAAANGDVAMVDLVLEKAGVDPYGVEG